MLAADELDGRRGDLEAAPELRALADRLALRVAPLRERLPALPAAKALLSADGGVCPDDGAPLHFDPWSPDVHRCARCGREVRGERHDRHWAKHQHLWLAERAADLAALAALTDDGAAAARARDILVAYGERYLGYPNRDNVLGPSRLFFSTYLESIWITSYVAAAHLLREAQLLDDDAAEAVSRVADEAANLIGEYDEGLSNRQTWNDAALAAIAVWFEDEELATRAIQGESGLLAHLIRGLGDDGMWYEGENYHLFALRGLLTGLGWARLAGVDAFADERLAGRLEAALRAPALSALPDFTFPARKDSRFGVSLAQPMYLELWEIGLARLRSAGHEPRDLEHWLAALYAFPAPAAQIFESYLHDAGLPTPARRTRADLSWWALLEMLPALEGDPAEWRPPSVLLSSQGLAILRDGDRGSDRGSERERYASLECGAYGGGHGHPDRLHLTLFERGVHWLADWGTGSYVTRDLFWYRSTLAHNAPRVDGVSQPAGDARCEFFEAGGRWAWTRGAFGETRRTLVAGPDYLLDIVELDATEDRLLELPWHFAGAVTVTTPGCWEPDELADEFVTEVERFVPSGAAGDVGLEVTDGAARLHVHLRFDGELLRGRAPGPPSRPAPAEFLVIRARGRYARSVAALSTSLAPTLQVEGELFEVAAGQGTDRHAAMPDGWRVESASGSVELRGRVEPPRAYAPVIAFEAKVPPHAVAMPLDEPPALDGSLLGFDLSEPLVLDHEDQYRRSEEPYAGPEAFAATAWLGWDGAALYVAVEVVKPEVVLRGAAAAPQRLDNEPDDINADGLQLYLRDADGRTYGVLVTPDPDSAALRARPVGGVDTGLAVRGAWSRTDGGYLVTVALTSPDWAPARGDQLGFDLLVNEMRAGRLRRAGQLVWSGGGGWVWLRGDRQPPDRFGLLELA